MSNLADGISTALLSGMKLFMFIALGLVAVGWIVDLIATAHWTRGKKEGKFFSPRHPATAPKEALENPS